MRRLPLTLAAGLGLATLLWAPRAWPVGDATPTVLDEGKPATRIWWRLRRAPKGRLRWIHLDGALDQGPVFRTPDAILVTRGGSGSAPELLEISSRGKIRRRARLQNRAVTRPALDALGRIVLIFQNSVQWLSPSTFRILPRPKVQLRHAYHAPPAMALDTSLYVALRSGYLTRVDGRARWRWRIALPGSRPGPPVFVNGKVLVCTGTGRTLMAVLPTGKVAWKKRIGYCDVRPIPLPGGDVVVATPNRVTRYTQRGVAVWSLHTRGRARALVRSPRGLFYAATDAGQILAFTPRGKQRWSLLLAASGTVFTTLAPLPDGGVAAASSVGELLVLDPAGHIRWHARLPKRPHHIATRWDGTLAVLTPGSSLRLLAPPAPHPKRR